MEVLKINEAKIILDDKGNGAGELIIASSWGYNFSTYWGSMGGSLKDFICSIDAGYFVGRLSGPDDRAVFDGKATMREVRKRWKEFMPWYRAMDYQKDVRAFFKELERCDTQEEFVHRMYRLPEDVEIYDVEPYDARLLKADVKGFVDEPWHYIQTRPSDKALWLRRLHGDLIKAIKSASHANT